MSLTRTQMFICILQGFTSVYVFRHNYYAEYHFLCMCMLSVTLCVWLLLCCRVRRGLPVWSISRPRICSPRKSWSKKMTVYRSAVFFFLFFCHMMHQNLNFLPQNSGYCGIIKKKKLNQKTQTDTVSALAGTLFLLLYILPIESVAMWCIKSLLEWSLSIGPPLDTWHDRWLQIACLMSLVESVNCFHLPLKLFESRGFLNYFIIFINISYKLFATC